MRAIFLLSLVSAFLLVMPLLAKNPPPNFVIALADDLGYGDLGCYGHPHVKTPHLDRLAAEGMRLTHCYSAAANCSPSRAGLMTGRIPWRTGVHNWIPMLSPMHVKASEITVASLLQEAGYQTCHVGKWHLNGMFNLPGQPQPDDHGFDHWFSLQNNALPNHRNPWNFVRNSIPAGPLEGYSADLVCEEAIRWLRDDCNRNEPFFLFVCFSEPHEPIASAPRHTELYSEFEDPSQRALYGNITQMDAAFGKLLSELESLNLSENTFVYFTSDNGPAITSKHPYGSTGGLRAKKGYLDEGGIRVPGIAKWPGSIHPGSVSDTPVSGVDLLPLLCEIASINLPDDRMIDGTSFLPVLKGKSIKRDQPLYWQFLRSRGAKKAAMRSGSWKITAEIDAPELKPGGSITLEEIELNQSAKLHNFSLFNLDIDPTESTDVKEGNSDLFRSLQTQFLHTFHSVQQESPVWPEWEWPRYESKRIDWPDYKPLRKPPSYK